MLATGNRIEKLLNFPQYFHPKKRWVGWRNVTRDGKPTKPPFCVNPGSDLYLRQIDKRAEQHLATFDQAVVALESGDLDGIGYSFLEGDPEVGIDLDGCIDPATGLTHIIAQTIINKFGGYWEESPSGTGWHGIVLGQKPEGSGTHFKGLWPKTSDKNPKIEVHGGENYYFTVTGEKASGAVKDCQEALDNLISNLNLLAPPKPKPRGPCVSGGGFEGTDDETLAKMFASKHGGKIRALFEGDLSQHGDDRSSADMALQSHAAYWTGCDPERMDSLQRRSALMRPKWDEEHGHGTYGRMTIDKAIANCTKVYNPPVESSLGPDDILPFYDYELPVVRYKVRGMLVEGTSEIWVGASGVGKSTVVTALADCVSKGLPFCGLETSQCPVLLIDADNPATVIDHRLKILGGIVPDGNFKIWGDWCGGLASIPSLKTLEWIDRCDPKPLIIVDCLAAFYRGKSENDSTEMRRFLENLVAWKSHGATIIILHNRGKDSTITYRGASVIKDTADVMRVITSMNDDTGKLVVATFEQEKNRMIREDSLPKRFSLALNGFTGVFAMMDKPLRVQETELMDLLKANPDRTGKELEELAAAAKLPRDAMRTFLKKGETLHYLHKEKDGKAYRYRYQDPPPQTGEVPF